MKYTLGIVVINYKTPELTIDCIKSLLSDVEGINYKIVIVDNQSGDNSVEILSDWLEQSDSKDRISLVESDNNSGFAGGNNLGISSVLADYYLLLNSDTIIRGKAITQLLSFIQSNPEVSMASPRLEWPDGTPQISCFRFPTPLFQLLKTASLTFLFSVLRKYDTAIPVSDEITYPEWTSFACVLIRKKVFDVVGMMDDRYFLYFEDSDFCQKVVKNDLKIANFPSSHVVHLRGGSSDVKKNIKSKKALPRYFYESRTLYFYQHYGRSGLLLANLLWVFGFLISRVKVYLFRRANPVCKGEWTGIWTNFLNPLKKSSML